MGVSQWEVKYDQQIVSELAEHSRLYRWVDLLFVEYTYNTVYVCRLPGRNHGVTLGAQKASSVLTMASHWTELPGHGPAFFDITVGVTVVAVVCFTGRTYTSFVYTKRFHLEYWLSWITLVCITQIWRTWAYEATNQPANSVFKIICVVSQIAFWIAVVYGLGAHEEDLAPSDVVVALRTTWISQISGLVAIVTGKLSIIEFLDQIRGRHRGRPWFLYIVGLSIVLVNLVVTVLPFFQCKPVDKLWDENVPGDCSLRELAQTYAYFQGSKSRLH